jgi:phosphohistidine phosphatase
METVAAAFEKVAELESIWHSPLVRARETAEYVAARFPKAKMSSTPVLAPDADPREAITAITDARPGDVVLVGHQPHLGRLFGLLVTGDAEVEIPIKKAAVARISFSGTHPSPPGSIKWLISPGLAQRIR